MKGAKPPPVLWARRIERQRKAARVGRMELQRHSPRPYAPTPEAGLHPATPRMH